jgi:hypothetical protein
MNNRIALGQSVRRYIDNTLAFEAGETNQERQSIFREIERHIASEIEVEILRRTALRHDARA